MASLALAIQDAIADALIGIETTDDAGATIVVPVHGDVPDDAAFPYVEIGQQSKVPIDDYDETLDLHVIYLSVWSRYRGKAQVLTVLAAMEQRLHDRQLLLASGSCVSCRVSNQVANREPDNVTYQGAMTVQVIAVAG